MRDHHDVILCFIFSGLTILVIGGIVVGLATGKIVSGNAIQQSVVLAIKEVFGDAAAYQHP